MKGEASSGESMNKNFGIAAIGLLATLALVGCSAQTDAYGNKSNSNNQVTAPKSSASSSESSDYKLLDDCKTYQANYEKIDYLQFLESESQNFNNGSSTKFKTSEFRQVWQWVKDEQIVSFNDVSFEIYALCSSKAGYELNVWTDAANPTEPSQPQTEYVQVPNIVGALDGEAKTWLFQNGYDFVFDVKSTGFNPKLSCLMSGGNIVVEQSPAAGTEVENSFSTRLTAYVECEN